MKPLWAKRVQKAIAMAAVGGRSFFTRLYLSAVWDMGPGVRFEGPIYRRAYSGDVTAGAGTTFGPNVCIDASKGSRIALGAGCSVNAGTFLCARESISIGANVLIGEYCSVRDNDHEWRDSSRPVSEQGFVGAPVTIGDDVWIGRSASIGKGVTIGKGAVIGAHAFVNKDVQPFEIVAGVPAKTIGWRKAES